MSKFDKIKKTLHETALLNRYLKSRGINPDFATKDQKVAHSKTAQFKTWMMHHINDNVMEAVDRKDTITMDIPLLIRVLEFAREDLKTDVDLHKMVERLIAIRGKGTLTMNQYGKIIREEFSHLSEERIDEISKELQHSYFKKAYAQKNDKTVPKATRQKRSVGMNKVINRTLRRNTISTPGASQDFKDQEAKRGIGHVRDHVEVEGTVVEAKEANYGGDYQSTVLRVKELAKKKPVDMKSLAARMQASYAKDEKKPVKEELNKKSIIGKIVRGHQLKKKVDSSFEKIGDAQKKGDSAGASKAFRDHERYANLERPGTWTKVKSESLEPMAACNQPGDGANNPDDTDKSTAKKVKLLLGAKKKVTEEMYDHEKEDKSVAGLKRPKVLKLAMDSTREAPQAAAVLKGGKTLTGEPRDTIEIDPMMRAKKPQKSV